MGFSKSIIYQPDPKVGREMGIQYDRGKRLSEFLSYSIIYEKYKIFREGISFFRLSPLNRMWEWKDKVEVFSLNSGYDLVT